MKLHIFAVRDRATDQFDSPLYFPSTGAAIRSFGDGINKADERNNLFNHPEDYDLYILGEWDTDSGEFLVGKPKQVAVGKDLKVSKNGQ